MPRSVSASYSERTSSRFLSELATVLRANDAMERVRVFQVVASALLKAGIVLVSTYQATGQLRAGDPMQLALALWTSMHGLAVLLTEGQLGRYDRPIDAAKLASVISGLLLEGFLLHPAATPPSAPAREQARSGARRREP